MSTLRPLVDFNSRADAGTVFARAVAVHSGLKNNPEFPNLPFDLSLFESALDDFAIAIANSLDRGKKALFTRDQKRQVVVRMLRQLAHYVEMNCRNNLSVLLSSGFAPVNTVRTIAEPLSHCIRKITQTPISGQQTRG